MKRLLTVLFILFTLSLSAQNVELHPVVELGNNEKEVYPRLGGDVVLSLKSYIFDLDFEIGYRGAFNQKLNHRFQLAAIGQLSLTGESKNVTVFGGAIYHVSQYDFEPIEGGQRQPYFMDDFGLTGGANLNLGKLQLRVFAIGSFYEVYGAIGLKYRLCKYE